MRTLHCVYRVTDLDASLDFYRALGYRELGRIAGDPGTTLSVLAFPGEPVASLVLLHRPGDGPVEVGNGFDHLLIQVHDLAAAVEGLVLAGLEPTEVQPPTRPHGPAASWVTDPDGYRIALVEWPAGHPAGITVEDLATPDAS